MGPSTRSHDRSSGLIELIGPAGSGKTTLLQALRTQDPTLRSDLSLWDRPLPWLALGALGLVPVAVRAALEGQPLRMNEFAQMIRLAALRLQVQRALRDARHTVVMDEGPIFCFAWLRVRHGALPGLARADWRARTLAAWAPSIALVVRLDNDDAALRTRIRTRAKEHPKKRSSDTSIDEFTAVFRAAFDGVLADARAVHPIRLLMRRTDHSPTSLGATLLTAIRTRSPDDR